MDTCGAPACCPEDEARKKQEETDMNREVNLNGGKFKIKDLFPDYWQAKDFISKLNLIEKTSGGKELMETSPADMMQDDALESDN